ncbi:hypothetical protein GGR57DRAFT_326673 [Xylariaceae sp. FL1272]|nr:hypothetical protein GGR57DRAFT_326673 [Xylariaceae sp. FL1272]
MFQSFQPPPVGYSQPTTGARDYCTTQSASGSIDLTGPASPYYSSPESRSSDTLDRNLTPASDVGPSYHRTFELPIRAVGHHTPSSQGMLPSPPASTTYDGEDTERLRLQQLQSSNTSFPVSSIQSSGSRLVGAPPSTDATSWSASTSHPPAANFHDSFWSVSNPAFSQVPQVQQVPQVSQVSQGGSSTQFDSPLEHQGLESPLDLPTNYSFTEYNQHDLEPQTPDHHNEMAMLSEMADTTGFSSHEASPAMTNDLMELEQYQLEDEGDVHDQPSPTGSMRSHGSQGGGKGGKDTTPYAKLIFECLMAASNKTMSLQDIYRWFEQNTDKGHDGSKGWQNSIRHNLSMNKAFKKTNRERSGEVGSGDAAKKSTDWTLEEWAINQGVQSTTRYRKGSGSRRTRKGVNGGVNKSSTASGALGPRRCTAPSRTPESALTRAGRGQIVPARSIEGNGYSQRQQQPYRAPQLAVDVYHQQPTHQTHQTHQTPYYSPGHMNMHLSPYHAGGGTSGASSQSQMMMPSSMSATTMPTTTNTNLTSSGALGGNNALHSFNYGAQGTAPVQGMTSYHQPQYTSSDIGLNRIAGVYPGAPDATSDHMGVGGGGESQRVNNMAALNRSFFPPQQHQPDWNSVISDGGLSDRIPYHH